MGWGASKKQRDELLGQHYVNPKTQRYAAVVVDMCSEARRMGSGPRAQSAEALCSRIAACLFKKLEEGGHYVIMFDCQSRMHSRRAALHMQRYKPLSPQAESRAVAAGKIIVAGSAYAQGSQPYTAAEVKKISRRRPVVWNRLWSSPHGKARSWKLIYTAMAQAITSQASDTQNVVMWFEGKPFVWPPCRAEEFARLTEEICNNTYGEADQRVAEAAQVLARQGIAPILIQTIDTDMIIQALCAPQWGEPGTLVHLQLKNEIIDLTHMCKRFGDTPERRINAAFWLLTSAGVDYCKGITRFGFSSQELREMADTKSKVIETTANHQTIALQTQKVIQELKKIARRNIKKAMAQDFQQEMADIMFCIALFVGISKTHEPAGGPTQPDAPCFTNLSEHQPFTTAFLKSAAPRSQNIQHTHVVTQP